MPLTEELIVHIHGADVVLFLHIFVAVVTFAVAGVLLVSLGQLKSATDIATVRIWARISVRTGPIFPVLVLILIGLGAWLVELSDSEFAWSNGWVIMSVATLVVMEGYGGMVLAPSDKKLSVAVNAAPDGPVPDEIRREILNPLVWGGAYGNTGAALGILFVMPTKPSGPAAIIIIAAAALVGVVIGLRLASVRGATAVTPARS